MKGAKVTRGKVLGKLKVLSPCNMNCCRVLFLYLNPLFVNHFILINIHVFRSAKGSSKKSKKPGNAKETKDKGSVKTDSTSAAENSVEAKSRKSKTASLTNSSTSADQTAAG